jgi:hypothetical protein
VNDEQYLDERRQRQDARRHEHSDKVDHAKSINSITNAAILQQKHLDQVNEAGAPAAAP